MQGFNTPLDVGDAFELTDDLAVHENIDPIDPDIFNPKPKKGERIIELTRGYISVVDEVAYREVAGFIWSASVRKTKVYAVRCGKKNEGGLFGKIIYMHRQIAGILDKPDLEVDHIRGNSLYNATSNLRVVSRGENMRNCISHGRKGTSQFRGVYIYPLWTKGAKTYGDRRCVAYVNFKGKKYSCGRFHFSEEVEAALARDKKVIELMDGVSPLVLRNILNFPEKFCKVEEFQPDEDIPF